MHRRCAHLAHDLRSIKMARFTKRQHFLLTPALSAAVEAAADRSETTVSEYLRAAARDRLQRDGFLLRTKAQPDEAAA